MSPCLPNKTFLFVDNNNNTYNNTQEASTLVYCKQFFGMFPLAKLAYLALKLTSVSALHLRSLTGWELV